MKFDKSELQIFANYCVAAAESMAYTLIRTAHSTFIKETEDFSCTIMTPEGLTFASPKTLGATWYVGLDYGPVLGMIDEYKPGDICMTNDPYSGFIATHTPDVVMWKPVFYKGEIVCFVGGHIHNTDMGGAVPASLSRTLTEIYQEGIRFPPTKIVREGELNEELLTMMMLNVRAPEQNRGDLKAQIASLMTGERRILEIIESFGADKFRGGMDAMLDYSEEQARTVIRTVPNGEYFFAEYADEDSVNGKPMRVALTLRIKDGALDLDYTGSDPQLSSSLNVPTGGRERHVLGSVGLNYVLYSLNPDILLNAGMLRIARCIMPKGTIMNPVPPAAVGMRSLTCKITHLVTIGAFSRAIPHLMPACPAGGMSILNVKTMDSSGKSVMASIGPVGGGAGGSPYGDGSDASGANSAFLRNTPVEINEAEIPIRILKYGIVPGSSGPGKYRGGLGTIMEFQVFSPNSTVTARNRDRSRFASWGVLGGQAGANSFFTRNPGQAGEEDLGNTDLVACQPGDVIRLEGAGGGGYGHPFERDVERVLTDVRRGHVSVLQARAQYGVAIVDGEVQFDETMRLRASMSVAAAKITPHFSYGPRREQHEALWTDARYTVLTECLAQAPVTWRYFLKHKIFDAMTALDIAGLVDKDHDADTTIVRTLFDDMLSKYPDLARAIRLAA